MATLLKYKKGLKRPTLAWNECRSLHRQTDRQTKRKAERKRDFAHLKT